MKFSNRILQVKPSPTLEVTALANAMKAKGIDVIGFGTGEPDFDTPEHHQAGRHQGHRGRQDQVYPFRRHTGAQEGHCREIQARQRPGIQDFGGHRKLGRQALVLQPDAGAPQQGRRGHHPLALLGLLPAHDLLADGMPVIVDTTEEQGSRCTRTSSPPPSPPAPGPWSSTPPRTRPGPRTRKRRSRRSPRSWATGTSSSSRTTSTSRSCTTGSEFFNIANVSEKMKKKTIVMNGVSKAYSMTGWRIGYMAGDAEIMAQVETLQSQSTSNPTSISQWAAVEALNGDQSPVGEMVAAFDRRRKMIVERPQQDTRLHLPEPQRRLLRLPRRRGSIQAEGLGRDRREVQERAQLVKAQLVPA